MVSVSQFLSPYKRLFAPLYLSFLVLVILMSGQMGLSIWMDHRDRQIFQRITHSLLVQRETEHLLNSNLDEITSFRGYLLTQDSVFLPAFHRAGSDFYTTFYRLHEIVRGNHWQRQQLNQLRRIHDRWHNEFVLKVLKQYRQANYPPPKVIQLPFHTELERLQAMLRNIVKDEKQTFRQQQRDLEHVSEIRFSLNLMSILTILCGVAWNIGLLRRRVVRPLLKLMEVGELWQTGNLEARLNFKSTDELGQLAQILDTMALEIRDRQQQNEQRYLCLQDLISGLSHDLRTPLLATRNTLRPMLNGAFGAVNETWTEILTAYQTSNEELLDLVNVLLDVSRYEANGYQNLTPELVNWEKICTRATHYVTKTAIAMPQIQIEISPQIPPILADPLEIQRVIQNLLENAIRVSHAGDLIRLAVSPTDSDWIEVIVADQGPGISPQEKGWLFQRFVQGRDRRGKLGLGLYLCRKIVEAHGGSIGVTSQIGQGSTFWFRLPHRPPFA